MLLFAPWVDWRRWDFTHPLLKRIHTGVECISYALAASGACVGFLNPV